MRGLTTVPDTGKWPEGFDGVLERDSLILEVHQTWERWIGPGPWDIICAMRDRDRTSGYCELQLMPSHMFAVKTQLTVGEREAQQQAAAHRAGNKVERSVIG